MFHSIVIFWNLNIKWGLTINGNETSLAQVHLKYFFLSSAAIVKTAFQWTVGFTVYTVKWHLYFQYHIYRIKIKLYTNIYVLEMLISL
jgi:hypothetical protein